MVWDWGKLPKELPVEKPKPDIQPKPTPTEIKHMVLERIYSESPPTEVPYSSSKPIRRRRRYDSEPAMAHVTHTAPPSQISNLALMNTNGVSPLSDGTGVDSGTDCLASVYSDDEISNEVSMSLCG